MGNRLFNAVNVAVRRTFRLAATGKAQPAPNGNGHGYGPNGLAPMEATPLLAHRDIDDVDQDEGESFWGAVFFDRKRTPGTDSHSPLVWIPATVWNVSKVTLLSCTYMRRCRGSVPDGFWVLLSNALVS